jgi:hypothetical protein
VRQRRLTNCGRRDGCRGIVPPGEGNAAKLPGAGRDNLWIRGCDNDAGHDEHAGQDENTQKRMDRDDGTGSPLRKMRGSLFTSWEMKLTGDAVVRNRFHSS